MYAVQLKCTYTAVNQQENVLAIFIQYFEHYINYRIIKFLMEAIFNNSGNFQKQKFSLNHYMVNHFHFCNVQVKLIFHIQKIPAIQYVYQQNYKTKLVLINGESPLVFSRTWSPNSTSILS